MGEGPCIKMIFFAVSPLANREFGEWIFLACPSYLLQKTCNFHHKRHEGFPACNKWAFFNHLFPFSRVFLPWKFDQKQPEMMIWPHLLSGAVRVLLEGKANPNTADKPMDETPLMEVAGGYGGVRRGYGGMTISVPTSTFWGIEFEEASQLGGGFKYIFLFSPRNLGRIPISTNIYEYFPNGLKPPTSSQGFQIFRWPPMGPSYFHTNFTPQNLDLFLLVMLLRILPWSITIFHHHLWNIFYFLQAPDASKSQDKQFPSIG